MSCCQHRPVHTTPSTCAMCRRLVDLKPPYDGNLINERSLPPFVFRERYRQGLNNSETCWKRKGQKQTVSCQVRSSEHFFPAKSLTDLWVFVCGQWIFARFSKDFSWWRQCMLETQHGKASGIISCHRSSILWENFTCTLRCQTRKHSPGQGCSLHDIYGVLVLG